MSRPDFKGPDGTVGRHLRTAHVLELFRTQKLPIHWGASRRGFHGFIRLPDGGLVFGVKLTRDRIQFANAPDNQYGVSFWCRRSFKGNRGSPHAITFKVHIG